MYIFGSESVVDEGKIFTREVGDRVFSSPDFRLPVYHKRQWKWTQWKDLGQKMSVPLVAQSHELQSAPDVSALGVLYWYQGFDEESGQGYVYLYRTNDDVLDALNQIFCQDMSVAEDGDILRIQGSNHLYSVSIEESLSVLFVLHLLWGKWEDRGDVLHGIKITIPLISSTMQYQETITGVVDRLRQMDTMIKMDTIQTQDGIVIQLASRDVCLLEQFALWYKPLATWEVISTKDVTDSLVAGLKEFVGDDLVLAADHMIKIGSVQ